MTHMPFDPGSLIVEPLNRFGADEVRKARPRGEQDFRVLSGMLCLVDTLLLGFLLAGIIAVEGAATAWRDTLVAGVCGSCIFLVRAARRGTYDITHLSSRRMQAKAVVLELSIGGLALAVVLLMLGANLGKAAALAGCWFGAGCVLLGSQRAVFLLAMGEDRLTRRLVHRVAIIGDRTMALRMVDILAVRKEIRILGSLDYETAVETAEGAPSDAVAWLSDISRTERLDIVVVSLPSWRRDEVARLCYELRKVLADVYVVPQFLNGYDQALPETRLGPLNFSVVQRRPLSEWQLLQKAVFDRLIGAILLLCFSPLMLLIALLVRIDTPGPIFFRQPRLGLNNRLFEVFKFRTMHHGDRDMLSERQTSRDDARVTSVGRWLRRLSLDELPQLLNVLAGSMSLVGPRPHAPNTRAAGQLLGDALAEYVIRHQIKPGITGWAQVNGSRGELKTVEQLRRRVSLDLEYMRRWTLMFDLKVLVLTVVREIFSRHAY